MRKKSLSFSIAIIGALLITATNGFSFDRDGDVVNDACAPKVVYSGDCALCHVSDKHTMTDAMKAYEAGGSTLTDFFCPETPTPTCTDNDNDTYSIEGGDCGPIDCNDEDAAINPGADENCNDKVDNNCNNLIDDLDPAAIGCPVCTDNDGDSFAAEGGDCGPADCDDNNSEIHPDADEICGDGIDNDCNGVVDTQDSSGTDCPVPVTCSDVDGDTYAIEGGDCGPVDCNDNDASVSPGTQEVCGDNIDNNCDDEIDEGCDTTCPDLDGDGHQDAVCGGTDCNDNDAAINPGADENCNDKVDNNCNNLIDDLDPAAVGCLACSDNDGDSFAAEGGDCGPVDCDDTDGDIHPDALEVCGDGIDNDCNGLVDTQDSNGIDCPVTCIDADGDTYSIDGGDCGSVDCNDNDATINPGTKEVCGDNIDNDCDDEIDEGCDTTCPDLDGDGHQDAVCGGTDCNDNDANINPAAAEVCGNGVDENCNGTSDDICQICPDGTLLVVKRLKYNLDYKKLYIKGRATVGTTITIINADTQEVLAEGITVERGRWLAVIKDVDGSIKNITVMSSSGCSVEKKVETSKKCDDQEDRIGDHRLKMNKR